MSGRADAFRSAVELAQDDLAGQREMLSSRYDDIKSGKVKVIPGGEVFAAFVKRARLAGQPISQEKAPEGALSRFKTDLIGPLGYPHAWVKAPFRAGSTRGLLSRSVHTPTLRF